MPIDLAARPAPAGAVERNVGRQATAADPLARFVGGLCRMVDAVAGCIVIRDDRLDSAMARIRGRTAADGEADAALDLLLALETPTTIRGHVWLRETVPGHRALLVETTAAAGSGHLLLVFGADDLNGDGAIERVVVAVPGLAAAASAMLDTVLAYEIAAEGQRLLAAAMNQSECGIIVVRADHSVLFSNSAAEAVLASRDGIELRRDQIRPTRYQDAIRFQAALDHIMALPAEGGGPSRQSMMLLLDRPDHVRPLIAVIAPAAVESAEGGAAAIIYVMRPELSGLRGVEVICQLHGLSPVETQLVARLVAGTTLNEAAAEMRIKPDTARAYLKQVFAKTDTHRQADLIQLVIRYQRAVRGDFLFHAA